MIVVSFWTEMSEMMLENGMTLIVMVIMDTFARLKQVLSTMLLRIHHIVTTNLKLLNTNLPNLMEVVINTNPQERHGKRQKLPVNKWEDRI